MVTAFHRSPYHSRSFFIRIEFLNPAVIVVEVFLNLYVLFINRTGVPSVWKRVFPILVGLLPGIAVGADGHCFGPAWLGQIWDLHGSSTPHSDPGGPLPRPVRSTWLIGIPFGTALGVLYSVTTISGPPLAILFNNQGLVKNEFRAGLALVRVAESSVTAIVYYQLGLFIPESENLLWVFVPCRCGRGTAWRLSHPKTGCRNVSSNMHELRCVGRRIRSLPGVD